MTGDDVDQGFGPHRPIIQRKTGSTSGNRVEGRIDIVRAAFEGLHAESLAHKRPHQAQRDRGLARARTGRGDDQSMRHRQPTSLDNNRWRKPTIAPMMRMAGEPIPLFLASSISDPSRLSMTRSSSSVADWMSAAGVSAGKPPFWSAAVISSS